MPAHRVNDWITWRDGERLRRGRVVGWRDEIGVYIVEDTTWTTRQPGCGWEHVPYSAVLPEAAQNPQK